MAKSKLVKANEKIAEGVVRGYKNIEKGVVGEFNKIADKFVDNFLTKEGEPVEEARTRLAKEQKEREEASEMESEKRKADQKAILEASKQKAQDATLVARRKAGIE